MTSYKHHQINVLHHTCKAAFRWTSAFLLDNLVRNIVVLNHGTDAKKCHRRQNKELLKSPIDAAEEEVMRRLSEAHTLLWGWNEQLINPLQPTNITYNDIQFENRWLLYLVLI